MVKRTALIQIAGMLTVLAGKLQGESGSATLSISVPHAAVVDQDGKRLDFYKDLVEGKLVAIDFIFTTCTTVCLPMTSTFAAVQNKLGAKLGKDVHLISVSVDPVNDTPARLQEWSAQFHRREGWTFVTGSRAEIFSVMRAFGVPTGDKTVHTAAFWIGPGRASGRWFQTLSINSPGAVLEKIDAAMSESSVQSPAQNYFGDTLLIDQNGVKKRFYTDLLHGKVVIINSFFTTCPSVCPMMMHKLQQVQQALGDRVGKEIFFVSITVDPERDTPDLLKEFAAQFHPGPGWSFVTGDKEDVERVLHRLGQSVENKQDHSTILLGGHDATGYWKKLLSLAEPEDLVRAIEDLAKN